MSDERSRWYELLGLAPGASVEELKAAHRDLVKVWHPDRFSHDPRLQQKAQEKLKEINEAYDALASGRAPSPSRHAPAPTPTPTRTPPRRGRMASLFLAAAVCGAVFVAATFTLRTGGDSRPAAAAPSAQTRADPEPRPRPETPAAAQRARDEERPERESPRATAPPDAAPATAAPRPLPTVTVLIDPTTGLLATPACPVRSRTNYAAGSEPRRHCDAHRK